MAIEKKRALALVVGIDHYEHAKPLLYSVKDANDVADRLVNLGFTVTRCLDRPHAEVEQIIMKFGNAINGLDVALFYFAGHGMQLEDGENYLLAADTHTADRVSLQYSSVRLNKILDYMKWSHTKINIVILDACRENPFPSWDRSAVERGLASVNAPKGTLIAFSTSPGERASDRGTGDNGLYTECLLRHISDKNIPIEEFFKRVRTSVFELSGGKQTAWEHTSLIGDFFFNSGQMIHSVALPYVTEVIADGEYQVDTSPFGKVIAGLKSHTWDTQNHALGVFRTIPVTTLTDSQLFLFGRNLLQTVSGGSFTANDIFKNLASWLEPYSRDGENHVLNGILFEIYFNAQGQFRERTFKADFITEIFTLRQDARYAGAFAFIEEQLSGFTDYIFYMPSIPAKTLPIELIFDKPQDVEGSSLNVRSYELISIKINGRDVLVHKVASETDGILERTKRFLDDLAIKLCVPPGLMTISSNFSMDLIQSVILPWPMVLSKRSDLVSEPAVQ